MAEYCVSGCEMGKCKLTEFGRLIVVATELGAEVGLTDVQANAVVDAHGAMVARCTDYATSHALDLIREANPDLFVK